MAQIIICQQMGIIEVMQTVESEKKYRHLIKCDILLSRLP